MRVQSTYFQVYNQRYKQYEFIPQLSSDFINFISSSQDKGHHIAAFSVPDGSHIVND
jgi:hypothetical protein